MKLRLLTDLYRIALEALYAFAVAGCSAGQNRFHTISLQCFCEKLAILAIEDHPNVVEYRLILP